MGERVAMERDVANLLPTVMRAVFLLAAAAGFVDSCGIGSALSSVLRGVGLVGG
jgi:hypothetical protein